MDKRAGKLAALFGRATAEERDFLARLIVGELRQGALKGLMVEAIAAAADVPVEAVRRAAMSAGGLEEVALAALTEGAAALAKFSIVEIAFNEVQESSQYPGGLALRFARVKGYRPDKGPEEADTIDAVRRIYRAQRCQTP